MTKLATGFIVTLVVLTSAIGQQPRRGCSSSPSAQAFPRVPFQFTQTIPVADAQQNAGMNARRTTLLPQVPTDRIAIIESIAVKGQHPPITYVALELQTALRSANNQLVPARHFLYTRMTGSDSIPIQIRETTHIFADSGTIVVLGTQHTATVRLEQIAVTITGTLIDQCMYGQ